MMAPQLAYDFSGIVSTADQTNATYLPLETLSVHVFIADVSARVVLSQEYSHHGPDILPEAYYVFPVPARAAVCSFELRASNGMRLKGIVKELSLAKEIYAEARSKGWLTGLLEQFRQDARHGNTRLSTPFFEGAMPPNTEVTVTLSYVVDLSEYDQNSVRFQLPHHVGARYGAPRNSVLYHGTVHRARLDIVVDIEMPGSIEVFKSLNHEPFQDMALDLPRGGSRRHHFARKRYTSEDTFLGKDFLLIVHASGLDEPRCFAEQLSHREDTARPRDGLTTALALAIGPRFESKIIPAQEYIFLVDRSGSMTGSSIAMAKNALVLLLKQLPPTGTTFNIHSFGSTHSSLWLVSRVYSDSNVSDAMAHVDSMDADMGGTELLGALDHLFQTRSKTTPTSAFVLTDGFVYHIDPIIQCVRRNVTSAPHMAPVRVFALGIGDGASTELCERLALAGNGTHLMTLDGEDLAIKAIQQVKAMQTPMVEDMSIDWGVPDQVRQAPYRIPAFSPGMRLLVTAIIPGENLPSHVTLRVRLADGSSHNYQVQVRLLSHQTPSSLADILGGATNIPPLIHTLSAHLLIQDLEAGYLPPHPQHDWPSMSPSTRDRVVKSCVVELGTRYQVASSHTAFVAVAVPPGGAGKRRTNMPETDSQDGRSAKKQGSRKSGGSQNGAGNGEQTCKSSSGSKTCVGASANPGTSGLSNPPEPSHAPPPDGSNTPRTKPSTPPPQSNKPSTPPPVGPSKPAYSKPSSNASQNPELAQRSSSASQSSSESKTPRMPGAFGPIQPSRSRNNTTRGLFDFFTFTPSLQPLEEVVCFPNPLGDGHPPIIFTAPPPQVTTIVTMAGSWMKSLGSWIFPRNQSQAPKGEPAGGGPRAVSAPQNTVLPAQVVNIARLQSSNGSFAHISSQLSSIVGIAESELRSACPSAASAFGDVSETVWATAIALAFFREKYPFHTEMWGDNAKKATRFGVGVCGSAEVFEDIVREAVKLF